MKSVSQIAAEGMELQRIEGERAKKRQLASLKNQEVVRLDSNERDGNALDAVAASLGISRDRWFKLKTIFTKAQQGDAEARELMKALDAGDISVQPGSFPSRFSLFKVGVYSTAHV